MQTTLEIPGPTSSLPLRVDVDSSGKEVPIRVALDRTDPLDTGTTPRGADARYPMTERKARLVISNPSDVAWSGTITFSLVIALAPGEEPFFLLPSFLYGTNRADQPIHPKGKQWPRITLEPEKPPRTNWITVRSDRLSHPLAVAESCGSVRGIAGPPYVPTTDGRLVTSGLGVHWQASGSGSSARVTYSLGHHNAPFLYCARDVELEETGYELVTLPAGARLTVALDLFEAERPDQTAGEKGRAAAMNAVVESVYHTYHEPPRSTTGSQEALVDLATAIHEDAYYEPARNYCTSLRYRDGEAVQDRGSFSIAWTGGLQVATPLLMAALWEDDARKCPDGLEPDTRTAMERQARECIDFFVDTSLNTDSGLPYDAWRDGEWTVNGWWNQFIWSIEGKGGHSSYLVGQALYYLLKAYDWVQRSQGSAPKEWLDFASSVITRIETTKNGAGEYPYRWSERDGSPLEYDSFCGAWCLAARAYLALLTDDTSMAESCRASTDHYAQRYVSQMLCYGAPHDTWKAPDEEGILAYAKAVRLLHEATGEPHYLALLEEALRYEFSWKYCYNTKKTNPPLDRLGWSSCGGSVTSVANQCVHPMGNNIAGEIAYCCEHTGNEYYRSRLQDTVLWATQSYNRFHEEFDHGKTGWISERFDATPVTNIDSYPDGTPAGTWFIYHPWAAGCVVESMVEVLLREQSAHERG